MLHSFLMAVKNPRKPWLWIILAVLLYGLLLGVLAPWLIKRQAIALLDERAGLNLSIDKLRINPFLFTVNVEGLNITEPDSTPVAGFSQLLVDFEPTGIFRWAWSFDEVWLLGLTGRFERFSATDTNFGRLAERWLASAPPQEAEPEPEPVAQESSALPRLYFNDIRFEAERLSVIDHVPETLYHTDVGPIRLHVQQLSTLPDQVGDQVIRIVTDRGTQVEWQGELGLTPLASHGNITVTGPMMHIVTDYLRDMLNFTAPKDDFRLTLDYDFAMNEAGPRVAISGLDLSLKDFSMLEKSGDAPLFHLQELHVADVSLNWPEQTVLVNSVTLEGGEVFAKRLADGSINFASLVNQTPTPEEPQAMETPQVGAEPEASPWQVKNNSLALHNWQAQFVDATLKEPATLQADKINVTVRDFSTEPHSRITAEAELAVSGGSLRLNNSLQLFPLADIALEANIENLGLTAVQPYLQEYSRAVLQSGALHLNATVQSDSGEHFAVQGNLAVDNFHMDETLSNNELIGWQRFEINDIQADTAANQVQAGLVKLVQPFVEFAIEQDRTHTFGRVFGQAPAANSEEPSASENKEPSASGNKEPSATDNQEISALDDEEPAAPEETAPENPLHIQVAQVMIEDGRAHFADASLPLPFDTHIAKLHGQVSTIDNQSSAPSQLKLQGQIDEYGLLQANGALTPFEPQKNSDLKLNFSNVAIPDLTPYSVKFAGRKIDSGRLDLKLGYKIKDSQMIGENTVVLKKLELGEKVEQPDAMDLPLDLAIALLKDSKGEIDLDLAVKGDMNEPEFSVASVVGQALAKVIRSAVTAPFKLLGGLVGMEGDQLDTVEFMAGSAELLPPEREKLVQLAEALKQRPNLQLTLKNTYATEADTKNLQMQAFEASVQQEFGDKAAGMAQTERKYVRFVEDQYREKNLQPELDAVKSANTPVNEQGKKGELDTLAYVQQLAAAIAGATPISPAQLQQLAQARSQAIVDFNSIRQLYPAGQFVVQNAFADVKAEDDTVPVAFALSAQK